MNGPQANNDHLAPGGFIIQAEPEPPQGGENLDAQEMDFDFEGYQVVRGEFFSHLYEPSFSFNNDKVYVNSA